MTFKKKYQQVGGLIDARLLLSRDESISIRRQCKLLVINRSSYYYEPKPEKPENIEIMHRIDRHIQEEPTAGSSDHEKHAFRARHKGK